MGTLLERDDLLAELGALVERAATGVGSLVLVAGEAGAGKTSLVRALQARFSDSTVTLVGACDPLATPRPLSPLLDFSSDAESGLRKLFDGEPSPMEVFGRVLDRLTGTIRPTLMVIEDVHWADDATRDFLRFIGRRVTQTKSVVVCTYRDDEITVDHPLQPMLGQLARLDSTKHLVVPPLSESAVEAMVGDTGVDAHEVFELTGGNAFYVTELIAGRGTPPPTVQDAVLARVAALDVPGRRLVESVSIAPRSLDVGHAKALSGAGDRDIEASLSSGVLRADRSSLRFRHELARAAVESSLPEHKAIALHRQMLDLLGGSTDNAQLAHHAVCANAPELIVQYAPAAAREALDRQSLRQAAAFYEAALDHERLLDAATVAQLRRELGEALGHLGRMTEGVTHLEAAAAHHAMTGDAVQEADALLELSRVLWYVPDRDGSRSTIDRAIQLLELQGATEQLALAHTSSASLWMLSRKVEPATAALQPALDLVDRLDSKAVTFSATYVDAAIRLIRGEAAVGLEMLDELRRAAVEGGDLSDESWVCSALGSGGGEVREYDIALPNLERSAQIFLGIDRDESAAYCRAWMARIAFEQGRWDDVGAFVDLVTAADMPLMDVSVITAHGALGRLRVRRGDPGAREVLEAVTASGTRLELQHVWSPMCGLAEHAWLDGRSDDMEEILRPTWDRALDTDSSWAQGEVGFWMWKAGLVDRPTDIAAKPFALQMRGNWLGAAEAWREIGCPYEVALALSDGNEAAMVEAIGIFDDLGARPAATMVRHRLKQLGAHSVPRGPSQATRANPAGLTNRQLEVLELVAAGMSNGEIAEVLFLSKKTVEHHVSAVFTKLEVDTRAKAIAAAHEIGVVPS